MKKQTYILSILSTIMVSLAAFTLTAYASTSPPNDDFANAEVIVLAGGAVSVTRDNISATKEPGEPNHAENPGGSSVWFTFTPTSTQIVRIKTTNPSTAFDTTLAVYKGNSLATLERVGSNDDCYVGTCSTTSMVDLVLTAGTTYRIAVDGYNGSGSAASGSFVLSLTEVLTPVTYNNIETAYDLGSRVSASIAGTNHLATGQPGEPGAYSTLGGKSIWYRLQVPARRAMTVQLDMGFNGEGAVYSSPVANPTFAQLQKIDSITNSFSNTHGKFLLHFPAVPGLYYFIQVDFHEAVGDPSPEMTGNIQLTLHQTKHRYSTRLYNHATQAALFVHRPSTNVWYSLPTSTANPGGGLATHFGIAGDVPIPADFDGDALSNYAVTRNQNGTKVWYVLAQGSDSSYWAFQWGLSSDKEVVGDFDRDGIADATVIRAVNGNLVWYVRQSTNNGMRAFVYGLTNDRPVLGDFDGDGATEVTVVREVGGNLVWHKLMSNNGALSYSNSVSETFGLATDIPVAEDFDGDGKTDLAVYRPSTGTWMIQRSGSGQLQVTQFGSSIDRPQPADYDGDRKADLAVYRPTTGDWYVWTSYADEQTIRHWGTPGDKPLTSGVRFSMPEEQ